MGTLVILNNKSNFEIEEAKEYIKAVKSNLRTDLEIVVMPSICYLPLFYGRYSFSLGSQNVGYINSTGEVLPNQLKSMNVKYCLTGHSDRRIYYNENYNIINRKVKVLIDNNIKPIVCVGETLEEKSMRKTQEVLVKQLKLALNGIEIDQDIIIAYEPIWAIGSGKTPTVSEIKEAVVLLKNILFKLSGKNVKVLYGGSINKSNITRFSNIEEIDGFLIGGSSVDANNIIDILNLI